MKKNIFLPVILLLTLFCNSCVDEPIVKKEGTQKDKLHLRITTADPQIIETRAATDNAIQKVYVLLFDGTKDESLLQEVATASSSDSQNFYASLTKEAGKHMYVIANTDSKDSWVAGTTTLKQIKETLLLQFPQSSDGYITSDEIAEASPMIAGVEYTGPTGTYNVTLIRATAKVSVVNSSSNARYKLLGANAGNAPVSGYVFSGMSLKEIKKANYAGQGEDGNPSPENMMKGMEEVDPGTPLANPTTKPLYLFESSVADKSNVGEGTFVIIKGEYNGVAGYHKLNIWKRGADKFEFLEIQRNCHYKVIINKIYTTGYKTAKEAIANKAAANSDVDYGIDISDGVSLDIVTNGRYYLGLTNTEYLLYSPNALSGVEIATVATNATDDASSGTLDVKVTEGTGEIVCDNPFAKTNNGTFQSKAITPTIPATVLKAEFILRVGDLAQTIRFERISNSLAFGGSMELPQGYAYAKMLGANTGTGEAWASFTERELDNVKNGTQEFFNKSGKNSTLYLAYDNNLIFTADDTPSSRASIPADRTADALLFKANDGGHTRMHLVQTTFNIFNKDEVGDGKIDNPYVGAFWRYSQTGERVIKMTATTTHPDLLSQLTWTATVVVGQSWTRLQNGDSEDPTIYSSTPNLESVESNYQLKGKTKTTISGDGKNVTFRIGLTNQIKPDEHRYGLIIVATFLNNEPKNTYRIFTRQGEAPDYLFRKEDPQPNPAWQGGSTYIRPKAIKFSPFNLTDPKLGKGKMGKNYAYHNSMPLNYNPESGSDVYEHFDKEKFTKYPSQAGYLFIWNADTQPKSLKDEHLWVRAVHPVNMGPTGSSFNRTGPGVNMGTNPDWTPDQVPEVGLYDGTYSGNGDGNLPYFGGHCGIEKFKFTQIKVLYNEKSEPCPYGYRYPSMGEADPNGSGTKYLGADANKSELIQSMFYDSYISGVTENRSLYTLWGYYADGFFDRLTISSAQQHRPTSTGISQSGAKNSTVYYGGANNISNLSGNDIGYIGGLIFNPYNFSSLFHPAVGGYFLGSGMIDMGTQYAYNAKERESGLEGAAEVDPYVLVLFGSAGEFRIENKQGGAHFPRTVRCVRDESIVKNVTPAEYN